MAGPYPWNRMGPPWIFAAGPTGAPLPGAKLYFYETETATPLDTFQDPNLATPNTNPVVANQYGIFPPIFLQNQNYRVVWTDQNNTEIATIDPVSPFVPTPVELQNSIVFECTFDANGVALTAGKTGDEYVPVDCIIIASILQADQAGDFQLDIWVGDFVINSPPNITQSIVASAPPTLTLTQSYIDTTLPGWDTALSAGDAIRYFITSCDTVTRVTATLVCQPAT